MIFVSSYRRPVHPFTADHWKTHYWLHCIVLWVLSLLWAAELITALCPNVINIILQVAQWTRFLVRCMALIRHKQPGNNQHLAAHHEGMLYITVYSTNIYSF